VLRTSNSAEDTVAVRAGWNPVKDIMRASGSLPGKALPYKLSLKVESQRFKGMTWTLSWLGAAEMVNWWEPLMCKQRRINCVLGESWRCPLARWQMPLFPGNTARFLWQGARQKCKTSLDFHGKASEVLVLLSEEAVKKPRIIPAYILLVLLRSSAGCLFLVPFLIYSQLLWGSVLGAAVVVQVIES